MRKSLKVLMMAGIIILILFAGCGANESPADVSGHEGQVDGDPFAHLRIPFVGSAHETQAVVNALRLPSENWIVHSIQIGQDHGDFAENYSPYTLTIFYEPRYGSFTEDTIPIDIFNKNSDMLFDLIENLQAVTFMVRSNSSDDTQADSGSYDYRWSRSRYGYY